MKKITGIIYKYTSPSGKVYIGQTTNERKRRKKFLNPNEDYAGLKINNARLKYGPESFDYEVLEKKVYNSSEECIEELNKLEIYYIGKYDSFKNGYNMSIGGEGSSGYKMTDEQKAKHTKRMLENNPFKGHKHTEETKRAIGKANSKAVLQIDKDTDEIIREFESAKVAGEFFGKPRANSEIIKVCKNYVSPSGKKYLTALGYKWRYKNDESSTTIESTSNDGSEQSTLKWVEMERIRKDCDIV